MRTACLNPATSEQAESVWFLSAGFEACIRSVLEFPRTIPSDCDHDMISYKLLLDFMELPPMNDHEVCSRAQSIALTDAASGFPKLVTVVDFFMQFKNDESVHGIVFVKTRNAVNCLVEMLR